MLIYVYSFMYTHSYTNLCILIHVYSFMYTYSYIHSRILIHVYSFICSFTCTHSYAHLRVLIYILIHVYSFIYSFTYTHSYSNLRILIFQCLDSIFDTCYLYSFKAKVLRVLLQLESPNSEPRNSSYVQNNPDYSMFKNRNQNLA